MQRLLSWLFSPLFLCNSLLFCQLPSRIEFEIPSHVFSHRYTYLKKTSESNELMTQIRSQLKADYKRFQSAYASFQLLNKDAHDRLFSYREGSPSFKTSDLAQFYDAYLYFLEKEYERAYNLLVSLPEEVLSSREYPIYLFLRGYCHYYKGEYKRARSYLGPLTEKLNPYHHSASYYDGLCAFHLGQYKEALSLFLSIEKVPEYEKKVPYLISFCLLELGEFNKLKAYVEELASKDVENKSLIYLALGSSLFRQGKCEEALPYLKNYLEEVREPHPSGAYQAGYCYLLHKDYNKAKELLFSLSEREDTLGQASAYYLGFALNALDQKEEARLAFHRAFSLDLIPEIEADALVQYAKISFDLHYYDEAFQGFQAFLTRYPSHPRVEEINKYLGDIFLFSRQFKKAIEYYKKSKLEDDQSQRNFQYACYYYAMDLYRSGKLDSSLYYLQLGQNVEGEEEFALEIQFWISELYSQLKKYSLAIKNYQLFINHPKGKTHPRFGEACIGLGWIYLQKKQVPRAIFIYKKALDMSEKPEKVAEASVRIGDAYFLKKDYQKAISYYQKALQLSPHYEDYALYQLGRTYFRLNEYQKAAVTYERLIQKFPFSIYREQSLLEVAELYLTWIQDYPKAEYYAKQLLLESPNSELSARAHLIIASCAYNSGDKTKAKKEFLFVLNTFGRDQEIAKISLEGLANLLDPSSFDSLYHQYRQLYPNVNPNLESVVYESIVKYYDEKRYKEALNKGKVYLNDYKTGKFYEKVLLLMAQSAIALQDTHQAITYLNQLFKEGFEQETRVEARKLYCSILLSQGDSITALPHLIQLVKEETNPYELLQETFILAELYIRQNQLDSANYYLDMILKAPTLTQFSQHKAQLLKGYIAYLQGDKEKAKKLFQELQAEAKDVFGAQALFYLTQIALEQKEFDKVYQYAMHFKEAFPTYNYWKAKTFILLGDSYYAQGKKMQAIEIWKSILNNVPYQDVKESIQLRLKQNKDV